MSKRIEYKVVDRVRKDSEGVTQAFRVVEGKDDVLLGTIHRQHGSDEFRAMTLESILVGTFASRKLAGHALDRNMFGESKPGRPKINKDSTVQLKPGDNLMDLSPGQTAILPQYTEVVETASEDDRPDFKDLVAGEDNGPWLSRKEAAEALGVSVRTVGRRLETGELVKNDNDEIVQSKS